MRLKRYKRFVESDSYDKLKTMLNDIDGFDFDINEYDDVVTLVVRMGSNFELYSLLSLFSHIAVIEKSFSDVVWQEEDGEFIFEFYI